MDEIRCIGIDPCTEKMTLTRISALKAKNIDLAWRGADPNLITAVFTWAAPLNWEPSLWPRLTKDYKITVLETIPDTSLTPLTSVAGYAGPSSSVQTTPEVPVLLSEVQSGVQHLLGLISLVAQADRTLVENLMLVAQAEIESLNLTTASVNTAPQTHTQHMSITVCMSGPKQVISLSQLRAIQNYSPNRVGVCVALFY